MNTNLKIKRFDGNKEKIEEYNIDITERTTILEALIYIKENIDPTLSFRAQCRAAICGTCAVKVGEKHLLACKTKIKDLKKEFGEILIEPLSNMPVIKDLVVDHNEFINKLKDIKAWFIPKENFEPVYPEDLKRFEKETDCILCGACYSACPAFESDKEFGGPINFVKVFRFWKDKNDALGDERIVLAEKNHITSCVHCKFCTFICPKEIPVETDITQIEFYGQQKGIIKKKQDFGFGFGFPNF
ncbi:succinate dehydrogenase/fumarate reductase iron-sulfur subunit [Hydrogenothermus marinus]|uniref:Fumarate reductase iron-sulfur subunit n=1 Tax=Hydrogenothermus marinus TaxID=133270 RepID=A0A3M0B7W6_9AQUI|nr:succinate dehydrogenase/fumarate reductase iron-sulfur subunit [Hydrogenothermus marinus]RMA93241.1 succinate dehydrogenase / fumarate reductase iron-sulfur subunit/fumarate reductase iron-sulfur subunit [Hydrogenothermus marinus]